MKKYLSLSIQRILQDSFLYWKSVTVILCRTLIDLTKILRQEVIIYDNPILNGIEKAVRIKNEQDSYC